MNISRHEQCVLHARSGIPAKYTLRGGAQGGRIQHRRCPDTGRILAADCFTRDGHVLSDCTLGLFRKLKRRGLIASSGGQPYRVTRLGLSAVRGQLDNR
ncbi:YjhX family toxin [Sphingomonas sp.]|uniref:YjhX family toxin n=1 Tax=Sphingomonas sp. TaxID=28214 RepID=UPI0025D36B72|nr:YjhX family toxin [Sphingomonas sp.]